MAEDNDIIVERDAGLVVVTLNRPRTKNSMSFANWMRLGEVFRDIAGRADDRVVVLTGDGGEFCSGADLGGTADDEHDSRRFMQVVNEVCSTIRDLPRPTIAAVSGHAVGAGFNLALACDLVVADESAKFSQIFVRRGLSVDFGGTWFLTHMTGLHRAKELAFFGRIHSAGEIHSMGLLNRVVPDGQYRAAAEEWARELLQLAPTALSQTKELLNFAADSTLPEALAREAMAQGINSTTEDGREAVAAFREKRPPKFTGR